MYSQLFLIWKTLRVRVKGMSRRLALVSLRDFYEPFLNELSRSRHGIRVDLDVGKQIGVPPVVNFRGRATQLNVHPTFHQVSDELLVGIAGRYVPFGVVGAVVQGHVASVRVKDGDDLRLGVPIGDVVLDKLKVENRSRQISFERQAPILYTVFTFASFTGISMRRSFSEPDMSKSLSKADALYAMENAIRAGG
jgi:hypothetical protein